MRQTIEATEVSVSDAGEPLTVAFRTIDPDDGVTHSLILMKDDEARGPKSIYLELNDQSNSCNGSGLSSVELTKDVLSIHFAPSARLRAGKVDRLSDEVLSELVVRFSISPERFLQLQSVLRDLLREGCGLSSRS